MNKVKLSWNKLSLTILSLGFIVLGIGCISWTIFTMGAASGYFAGAARSGYSSPVAAAAELNAVKGDSAVLTAPEAAWAPPPPEILYPEYPEEGDNIGTLTIPVLELEMPVLQGTGVNELKKGVGHFAQSVLPGEDDNCVFSGHRETFFRQLGSLKVGDLLIVQTSAGIFTYEVNGTRIVDADDKTVIVPTEHAVLTMTTCYPFNTPGYFPQRYIVSAALIKSE